MSWDNCEHLSWLSSRKHCHAKPGMMVHALGNPYPDFSLHAPKPWGLCQGILYGTIRTEIVTHRTFPPILVLSQHGYTMRRYLKRLFHNSL
jgi:hypothetical protein